MEHDTPKPSVNWTKILLVIMVFVFLVFIGSYFFYFIPQEKRKAEEEILKKENARKEKLTKCIEDADKYFKESWDKWCVNYGLNTMEANCSLSSAQSDMLYEVRKLDIETCNKLYGEVQE